MRITHVLHSSLAVAVAAATLSLPASLHAQESHREAEYQAQRHDAHQHTKAKFVGGGAVGGALVGAKVGGPVGALVGAGAGAGAGLALNKAHRHHEVKERERHGTPHYDYPR